MLAIGALPPEELESLLVLLCEGILPRETCATDGNDLVVGIELGDSAKPRGKVCLGRHQQSSLSGGVPPGVGVVVEPVVFFLLPLALVGVGRPLHLVQLGAAALERVAGAAAAAVLVVVAGDHFAVFPPRVTAPL